MLPDSPRARLRWLIQESLVILGLFVFWVGVFLVISLFASIIALPYHLFGGSLFRPLAEFARLSSEFWAVLLPVTTITAGLYVLVRAGHLLIDYYHNPEQP